MWLKDNRGQSSIEFIILIGAFSFFFLLFLLVINTEVSDEYWRTRNFAVTEVALQIQQEIYLASQSTDGYYRQFTIPQTIKGSGYSVSLVSGGVYIHTFDGAHALSLPVLNVSGDVQLGSNTIRRTNGIVYLNT